MNILAMIVTPQRLDYAHFKGMAREPATRDSIADLRDSGSDAVEIALRAIADRCGLADRESELDMIAIRAAFGGTVFDGPVMVTDEVLRTVQELAAGSPLHAAALLDLLAACRRVFADKPIVLVFETSFFVKLPPQERCYALGRAVAPNGGPRRFGYHGIFHETACRYAAKTLCERGDGSPPRMLSICLEPRPEVAAVLGGTPYMVTSGATPMDGLPSHTACGELDPSIILFIADKWKWGAEQINAVLTTESGILGMTGRPATLAELFTSSAADLQPAREMIQYRMLRACGAGAAALGGVDALVFSGRYAAAGQALGPALAGRLEKALRGAISREIPWGCLAEPLDRIVADAAAAKLLDSRVSRDGPDINRPRGGRVGDWHGIGAASGKNARCLGTG